MIWGGEFGRSPDSDGGPGGSEGRDHNPYGFTIWMAGGGDQGRQGDRRHRRTRPARRRRPGPSERSARQHSRLLGLDHTKLTYPYLGRDFRLTDVGGKTDLVTSFRKARSCDDTFLPSLVFLTAVSRRIRGRSRGPSSEAAKGWTQAAVKQDAAGLKRFLADDLQYAHAGGQTQNKEQYIAAVTKGPARYESFTFSDLKIKLYGNAAVLTGFVDVKMVGQDAFRVRTLAGLHGEQRPVADGRAPVDPLRPLRRPRQPHHAFPAVT